MSKKPVGNIRWRPFGEVERGRLEIRRDVRGAPGPLLIVENITGDCGWESEALPVEPGAGYFLDWSIKCFGEGTFKAPEPLDDVQRIAFELYEKLEFGFHWYGVTDFIGLELVFLDGAGKEIARERRPMAVETHSNVLSGQTRIDVLKYRNDFSRYWLPVWLEFRAPEKAAALVARFRITSRAEINAGFAIAETKLEKAAADEPPREGFSRYTIRTFDAGTGKPVSARIAVRDAEGKAHHPPRAIRERFPRDYFYSLSGEISIGLPVGRYTFEAVKGFEYETAAAHAAYVMSEATESVELEMVHALDMGAAGWFCGDHHLHISGHATKDYPMLDSVTGMEMAAADGQHYVPYQADPLNYRARAAETLRAPSGAIGCFGAEFANHIWGHYCTFGAERPYEREAIGHVLYPTMYDVVKTVNERGGACVAAHPTQMIRNPRNTVHQRFDMAEAISDPRRWNCCKELPLILLLGEEAGYDLIIADGYGGQRMATREYYRMLDFGFRLGACASTDTGVNSADSRFPGPRTYIRAEELSWPALAAGLRGAHTFATNGPVVLAEAAGCVPGDTLTVKEGATVPVKVRAFSPWGLAFVEVIHNGRAVARRELTGHYSAEVEFDVTLKQDGWLAVVLRGPDAPWVNSLVIAREFREPLGQLAHTSPVFVRFDGRPFRPSAESAAYYRRWVANLRKIAAAHKHLLEPNAETVGVSPAEAWETICGRIDRALGRIDEIAERGWR